MIEELKSCPQDQCPEPKEPIIAALKFNYAFDKNLEQLKLGAVRLEQIEMIQAVNLEHRRYWQMVLQAQSSCVYNRRIALKYLSNHDYLEPAPYQFFNTLE